MKLELRAGGGTGKERWRRRDGAVAVKFRRAVAVKFRRAAADEGGQIRGDTPSHEEYHTSNRGHETSHEDTLCGVFFSLFNFRWFFDGGFFTIVLVHCDRRLSLCGTRSRG